MKSSTCFKLNWVLPIVRFYCLGLYTYCKYPSNRVKPRWIGRLDESSMILDELVLCSNYWWEDSVLRFFFLATFKRYDEILNSSNSCGSTSDLLNYLLWYRSLLDVIVSPFRFINKQINDWDYIFVTLSIL